MSLSEVEDDPEPYESSEDEWVERSVAQRRTSNRITMKKRTVFKPEESGTDKHKHATNKKRKGTSLKKSLTKKIMKKSNAKIISSETFATGSFVILKKDVQVGDRNKHLWIWRIDGKSLLQKYEPFEHDGKIRHKNTSVYTGWSPLDMDDYAPVTIDLIEQSNGKVIVEMHWEELKCIMHDDSD